MLLVHEAVLGRPRVPSEREPRPGRPVDRGCRDTRWTVTPSWGYGLEAAWSSRPVGRTRDAVLATPAIGSASASTLRPVREMPETQRASPPAATRPVTAFSPTGLRPAPGAGTEMPAIRFGLERRSPGVLSRETRRASATRPECPAMVTVPAGSYTMGSPSCGGGPPRRRTAAPGDDRPG